MNYSFNYDKPHLEIFKKLEITSSQILKDKIKENIEEKIDQNTKSLIIQNFNLKGLLEKSQEFIQSQQLSDSISPSERKRANSFDDLQSKLNGYIEQYINELKEPQHFLDTLSLQNSEILDEGLSQNSVDLDELCQKIYQKIIAELNLSVIQSNSIEQTTNYSCSPKHIHDQLQVCTLMTTSTPITPGLSEDLPTRNISNSAIWDQLQIKQCSKQVKS